MQAGRQSPGVRAKEDGLKEGPGWERSGEARRGSETIQGGRLGKNGGRLWWKWAGNNGWEALQAMVR